MRITFGPFKRAWTLAERELDFLDAAEVFSGPTIDIPNIRRNYGETRAMSVGYFRERMVIVVWTARDDARHVISMRKANDREEARYRHRFEEV